MKMFLFAALFVLAPLCGTAQESGVESGSLDDIYIGTIDSSEEQIVLTRCDLGGTPYVLIEKDVEDAYAIRERLDQAQCGDQRCYGVVIGAYLEGETGQHQLAVSDIQDLTPGKSCHLSEAIDALLDLPTGPSEE